MSTAQFIATASGTFSGPEVSCPCALGRSGTINATEKREGDGATPLGTWRMLRVYYRADRLSRPETDLPTVALRMNDGWCDAPDHPLYNRPVTLPFAASHENLWREDHAYDVIVELSHNRDPIVPGLGSAVFFHLAHDDGRPTEGCVAVALDDMLSVLRQCSPSTDLEITR